MKEKAELRSDGTTQEDEAAKQRYPVTDPIPHTWDPSRFAEDIVNFFGHVTSVGIHELLHHVVQAPLCTADCKGKRNANDGPECKESRREI